MTAIPSTSRRDRRRSNMYFVWRGVLGDPVARIAAGVIAIMILAAVFAPWIAPWPPNEANPELRLLPPGTPVKPVPWQAPGAAAAPAASAAAPASAPASAAKP